MLSYFFFCKKNRIFPKSKFRAWIIWLAWFKPSPAKFSKVSSIVVLYSKCSGRLTFENFCMINVQNIRNSQKSVQQSSCRVLLKEDWDLRISARSTFQSAKSKLKNQMHSCFLSQIQKRAEWQGVSAYVYTYVYIHTYLYMYMYISICIHIYIYTYIDIYTYMYTNIYIYMYYITYIYKCIYIYIYIHTSMYIYTWSTCLILQMFI